MEERSLYSKWESVLSETLRSIPGGEAFLMIDAAQLPFDAMPWAECLQHGQVANVSADEPEADHPEVCALLARHGGAWIPALLSHYLAQKPFAFTALVVTCGQQSLVQRLARAKRVRLPDGQQGLLRIYDAAVLQALPAALSEANRTKLLACADAWVYLCRDGRMGVLQGGEGRVGNLTLTTQERDALEASGIIDRVLATLTKNGRLCTNTDPFEGYLRIAKISHGLYPHGGAQFAPLYRCSAMTAQVPFNLIQEHWGTGAFLAQMEQGEGLYDAVGAWARVALAAGLPKKSQEITE